MIIVHTHPEFYPDSRMETLRNIHRTCVLALHSNKSDVRNAFPKPGPIEVRY